AMLFGKSAASKEQAVQKSLESSTYIGPVTKNNGDGTWSFTFAGETTSAIELSDEQEAKQAALATLREKGTAIRWCFETSVWRLIDPTVGSPERVGF
ncbi:MAG: hypothetical protein KGL39_57320, partial [Patescibacteria group bacterium]|nr:hypothetical protein [Patescibacteria group bacterium]